METGTSLQAVNTNFSSTNSIQSSDPSIGGEIIHSLVQRGGYFNIVYNGNIIVTPKALLLRLSNDINQSNLSSVNLSWWELPI